MEKNILLAGVGGQGLVLMTKLLAQASLNEGLDVKTNDVIGLSQRGGKVWGNVRLGQKVYSPNIPVGKVDIIVSLEPLEALRWSYMLKKDGLIIMNTNKIYPTSVQQEKENYPDEEIVKMKEIYKTIEIDANAQAIKLGKKEAANVIMLGVLSRNIELSEESWINAISDNVKESFIDLNIKAFKLGKNH